MTNFACLEFQRKAHEYVLYDNGRHGRNGSDCLCCPILLQGRIWLPFYIKLGSEDQQQNSVGDNGSSGIHIPFISDNLKSPMYKYFIKFDILIKKDSAGNTFSNFFLDSP